MSKLKAFQFLAKAYVESVIELLVGEGTDELNFHKMTLETDEGHVYVLTLMHVKGPKIPIPKTAPQEAAAAGCSSCKGCGPGGACG